MAVDVRTTADVRVRYDNADSFEELDGVLRVWDGDNLLGIHSVGTWVYAKRYLVTEVA